MTEETIRQAITAYLGRLPRSEWGNFWLIGATVYGDPKWGSDLIIDGNRKFNPRISELCDVLERMKDEGLVTRSGHTGWRLA